MEQIIIGFVILLFGGGVIIKPSYYSPKYSTVIDLTNIRYPFGITLLLIGGYLIFNGFTRVEKGKAKTETLICPKCEEVDTYFCDKKHYCSKCGILLEDIKGFYDRHPEHKDEA